METIDFSTVKDVGFNQYRLPVEYTEREYVSSILPDGKSASSLFVDTKVSGVNGCRIRGSIDSTDRDHSLYGARNQWTTMRFGFTVASEGTGKFVFMHADGEYRFDADTNIHFIDDNCSKIGYCLIDDQTPIKIDTTGSVSTANLYLFNDHSLPGGDYNGACTIYTAEFYKDQVLVCYPIPCTRNSDGVVGFYDIVNDRFLTASIIKGSPYLKAGPAVNKIVTKITETATGNVLWTRPS